jgi:hypothetical protein
LCSQSLADYALGSRRDRNFCATSAASRPMTKERFDARRNYGAILALMKNIINVKDESY